MFAAGLAAAVLLAQGYCRSQREGRYTATGLQAGEPGPSRMAAARSSARGAPEGHPADVLRVLDGDTFEARVRVWPGIEITTPVAPARHRCAEMKAPSPE